jgi:hypothetical protein
MTPIVWSGVAAHLDALHFKTARMATNLDFLMSGGSSRHGGGTAKKRRYRAPANVR